MRLENLTTAHEDADAIYKTDISDVRWIAYDIPGNIGWMTYLAMLAKTIRDKEYGSAAVSAVPAARRCALCLPDCCSGDTGLLRAATKEKTLRIRISYELLLKRPIYLTSFIVD
jgi:hypothetical protein